MRSDIIHDYWARNVLCGNANDDGICICLGTPCDRGPSFYLNNISHHNAVFVNWLTNSQ